MSHNKEDHLPPYRVRPRFNVDVNSSIDVISQKIKVGLEKDDAPCIGRVNPGFIALNIHKKDQHYWSPRLALTLEETEEGSHVRGLYGPQPSVWTMFIFFYSSIGFAILFISMIGLSKVSLGNSAPILWLVPILIVVLFSLYLVAYFGQKVGEKQMLILHNFLEESTGIIFQEEKH